MNIYLPRRIVEVESPEDDPLFFLAGPVRGGGDWQKDMCLLLQKYCPNCNIAVPQHWGRDHELSVHFKQPNERNVPNRQLDWEINYLELAGLKHKKGCIIFWLAKESETNPHSGPEPYSMDTRGEIGEWRTRMVLENARVVFGGYPGWHGFSQVERNIQRQTQNPDFRITTDMEDLAKSAISIST